MRRTFFIILLITAIGSALALPAAAGEHPWNNKRIYYVIENQGLLVEKGFFVRHMGSYEKQPCVVTEEEKHFYGADPAAPMRSVRTRTLTTLDGKALQRTESSLMGDSGKEVITVAGGEARIIATGAYGKSGRVPVPDDVLFEITGEWLASMNSRRGRNFAANVLDRLTHGVITADVRILDRDGSAANSSIWRAEITAPSRDPVVARYTSDGRLLRMEGGGMEFQVVGREDYELGRLPRRSVFPETPGGFPSGDFGMPDEVAQVDTGTGALVENVPNAPGRSRPGDAVIRIGEAVPAWDSFAWLVLHADPAYEWSHALSSSEYSRIEFNGVSTSIVAMQNAPQVDPGAVFPMRIPPEIQSFLGSSDHIPATHPSIIEAAYVAVADVDTRREETNVLRAVSYLAGWVNQSITLESWNGYDSSALDTLSRRSGDSLGHARLFSAMARTLGVPTRICQGFIAHIGQAINHCWSEAWIAGRWIPVDTTVSRVGLPAGYVLAERSQGDGNFQYDFTGFMHTPGLSIVLASAARETPAGYMAELIVGNRQTYVYSERDWMANLYWGFALRLPYSWTGQARLNSVELASDDRQASVRCEALEGEFEAGRAELAATLESLKANLDRFREIDSRLVSFDAEGATPAMFIDFTCMEDGVVLRCRQYVVPRRQRAFRISFWAPNERFNNYVADFDSILASFEF